MRAALLALALAGCGGRSGVDAFYGEVHVHELAGGSHPGALFLASATPAARVAGDRIVPDAPPSVSEGACTLTTSTDAPAPARAVDAGRVRIGGGHGIAEVELEFESGGYLPTAPVGGAIFDGGELLTVDGDGAAAPAFHGALVAPAPMVMTAPSAPGLGGGDFLVAWVPDRATRVDVMLIASTAGGSFAIVECIGDDAAGQVTIPSSLVAQLPPPPRDVQLSASRDQIVRIASDARGLGVIAHAGWAWSVDWHDN